MKLRVLMTAGGSGGHFYPMVAVAKDLQEKAVSLGDDLDLRFFGQPGNYKDYLKANGLKISTITAAKLRRYGSLQNILDIFLFGVGFLQALIKVYFFMPDVVFSKSGPGALPVILAARWYRIPVIIHESDTVAGLTNRIAGKMATIIEVAWQKAVDYFPENKTIRITGNPIRKNIILPHSPAQSREFFKLPHQKPVLLVVGGSQGAEAINYFILEHSEILLQNFEVLHVIGKANYQGFKAEYDFMAKNFSSEIKQNYHPYPYLDDEQMAHALNAADLVVSRAGSSIFEIAAVGKPSILIPLPASANNHQYENAYEYAKTGAAMVIEQDNLLINMFISSAQKIITHPEIYEVMSKAAKSFYKPEAATIISQDIITTAHPTKNVPKFPLKQ